MSYRQIETRDLQKINDVLEKAIAYHKARSEMNAAEHMANVVRYSPLVSELQSVSELVSQYESGALGL